MRNGDIFCFVGGVAGASYGGNITDCSNTGNIVLRNTDSELVTGYMYLGGIVGTSDMASKIKNCNNSGNLTGISINNAQRERNISCYLANIENCSNTGKMIKTQITAEGIFMTFTGGIRGHILSNSMLAAFEKDGRYIPLTTNVSDSLAVITVINEATNEVKEKLGSILNNSSDIETIIEEINYIANNTEWSGLKLTDGTREQVPIQLSTSGGVVLNLNLPNLTAEALNISEDITDEEINTIITSLEQIIYDNGAAVNRILIADASMVDELINSEPESESQIR